MSADDLEALPPDLRALLDAERARPVPDEARVERALDRVLETVSASVAVPPTRRAIVFGRGPLLAGALIAGAAVVASLYAARARPPQSAAVAVAARRVEARAPVAPAAPTPMPVAVPVRLVPPDAAPARRPPARATVDSAAGTDLAAERALMERAREALRRGDFGAADAAVRRHAQRFPRGQLTEAREALRVQALVGAGRVSEARAAGTDFRRRFPHSMLVPVVDAALRDAP